MNKTEAVKQSYIQYQGIDPLTGGATWIVSQAGPVNVGIGLPITMSKEDAVKLQNWCIMFMPNSPLLKIQTKKGDTLELSPVGEWGYKVEANSKDEDGNPVTASYTTFSDKFTNQVLVIGYGVRFSVDLMNGKDIYDDSSSLIQDTKAPKGGYPNYIKYFQALGYFKGGTYFALLSCEIGLDSIYLNPSQTSKMTNWITQLIIQDHVDPLVLEKVFSKYNGGGGSSTLKLEPKGNAIEISWGNHPPVSFDLDGYYCMFEYILLTLGYAKPS